MPRALGVLIACVLLAGNSYAQEGWLSRTPSPVPEYGHAVADVNGKIHALGGIHDFTGCAAETSHYVYDPGTNAWSSAAPMAIGRVFGRAASINGIVYVVGGSTGCGTRTASLDAYNPATNQWIEKAPMSSPRSSMAIAVLNGKLYVTGGVGDGEALVDTAEAYDPVTNQWTTLAPLPGVRYNHSMGAINGQLYVTGGGDNQGDVAEIDAYDPVTNTWTAYGIAPSPRGNAGYAVLNGRLFVIGGGAFSTAVDSYDPVTNTWENDTPLPAGRTGIGATAVNGTLYATGGFDNRAFYPDNLALAVAAGNVPPTADAGPNQSIHAGQTVHLDGSGSSDDTTATQDLRYAWTLASVPTGSTAALSDPHAIGPTFVADQTGTYLVTLQVVDAGGASSNIDNATISSLNAPPNAEAGADQGAVVGHVVTLNGSASNDPDSDPITFSWSLITRPAGSAATLSNVNSAMPTFVPDVAGSYVATLVVHDLVTSSGEDQVTIAVITAADFAASQTADAINSLGNLPLTAVTTKGNQTALTNFLTQAIASIQAGDVVGARKKLQDAIDRTDGCALRGAPDVAGGGQIKQDYITNCGDQLSIYSSLTSALASF